MSVESNLLWRQYYKAIIPNISLDLWKEVTKKCEICVFDKIVDLHHLDHNKNNDSRKNLIGLCPNHYKMIHDMRYSEEIKSQLEKIIH